jgi:hypothetical protein
MSIIALIIIVIVIGLLCWVVQTSPIQAPFNWVVQALLVLILVYILLSYAGMVPGHVHF